LRLPTASSFLTASGKRITEQQIREYLDLLKALPIRVETQNLWANVDLESLARRQNIAAYDAAYLDLARRSNLPLATSDDPLKQAAIAEGVIPQPRPLWSWPPTTPMLGSALVAIFSHSRMLLAFSKSHSHRILLNEETQRHEVKFVPSCLCFSLRSKNQNSNFSAN